MFAMDRMPVSRRRIDADGRLHLDLSNISKANVCPYYGREIPAPGLEPDRIYYLLRHPDELAAGAASFNNLPVLDLHIPVSAENPSKDNVVGSTGTDASFRAPYLTNSLVIWDQGAINRVLLADENPNDPDGAKDLSCAYRYTPDMTAGTYEGLRYDGIMRNILGNHVALVKEGRAGPDVVIGDCRLEMPKMLKSRRATLLSGGLSVLIRPLLAQDATLNLEAVLGDITAKNLDERKDMLATAIVGMATPKLAADKALDTAAVIGAIDAVSASDSNPDGSDDISPVAPAPAPAPAPVKTDPPAPIAADANVIRNEVLSQMRDVRQAERDVQPFIGVLDNAPDTAAEVYGLALDSAKVDHDGITDVNALRAMVRMLPKPDADKVAPTVAMDASSVDAFDKAFDFAPVKKV